jgi:hypothetical protein
MHQSESRLSFKVSIYSILEIIAQIFRKIEVWRIPQAALEYFNMLFK